MVLQIARMSELLARQVRYPPTPYAVLKCGLTERRLLPAYAMCAATLPTPTRIFQQSLDPQVCYTMSGTDIAYAVRCPVMI
eukprot:1261371-Rhodomonas_salina.1